MTIPKPADYVALMEEGHGSLITALATAYRQWPPGDYRSSMPWLWWQKILCVLGDFEYPNNINFYFFRETTPILRVLPTFGWFVGLGLVGMVLLGLYGRQRQAALIPLAAAAALLVGCIIGFAMGRYRMPLAVLMTIPAGATVSLLLAWWNAKRYLAGGIALLCAVALSFVSFTVAPKQASFAGETELIYEGDVRRIRLDTLRLRNLEYCEAARVTAEGGDTAGATTILMDYLAAYLRFLADLEPRVAALFPPDKGYAKQLIQEEVDWILKSVQSTAAQFDDANVRATFAQSSTQIVASLNRILRR
jgi:hypothetical protein